MKKRNNKGFTLAEVLISLTIIGVIAAITVPALIQRTNKQEYVTALQKAYSVLSQATNQIISEEGGPKCSDGGWACSTVQVYEMYKKHLNVLRDCGSQSGCLPPAGIKWLQGSNVSRWDSDKSRRKFVLSDGTAVVFENWISKDCSSTWDGNDKMCTFIGVELNGDKAPNQWGRDAFGFALREDGLLPSGCAKPYCFGMGPSCACKVLREGAVNY